MSEEIDPKYDTIAWMRKRALQAKKEALKERLISLRQELDGEGASIHFLFDEIVNIIYDLIDLRD